MELSSAAFWIALLQIIWVNILLSGDNGGDRWPRARRLQQKSDRDRLGRRDHHAHRADPGRRETAAVAVLAGSARVAGSHRRPLLLPEGEGRGRRPCARQSATAIRTIMIADRMSLTTWCRPPPWATPPCWCWAGHQHSAGHSALLLKVIERFPVIVCGAALLGFIAGELLVGDPAGTRGAHRQRAGVTQHSRADGGACWCWPSAKSCWLGGKLTES